MAVVSERCAEHNIWS